MNKFFLSSFLFFTSGFSLAQTIDQLADEIKKSEITFKQCALSMAVHESANGKSKVFKNKNNPFGIKNKKGKYVNFVSLESSVLRFKLIHDRIIKRFNPKTETQFLHAVCRYGYAKEKKQVYFDRVYRWFKYSEKKLIQYDE